MVPLEKEARRQTGEIHEAQVALVVELQMAVLKRILTQREIEAAPEEHEATMTRILRMPVDAWAAQIHALRTVLAESVLRAAIRDTEHDADLSLSAALLERAVPILAFLPEDEVALIVRALVCRYSELRPSRAAGPGPT